MPERRWIRPEHAAALTAGAQWERAKGHQYESDVKILKVVHGRIGERYLVQGLTSGRQWFVNIDTLLESYRPKGIAASDPASDGQTGFVCTKCNVSVGHTGEHFPR